jgi:hypothetical protein
MRCGAVLVVLCLVAGLGFQNETFSEEKVVYTDDFERSPLDRGLSAASPPATEWASGEGHSGTRSIRIHAKPGENIKWTMKVSIPVKKDVRHRVSFWAKCDPVYDHWGANFDVGTSRGEGRGIGYIMGRDGWRQWHIFFTPRRSDKITSFTFGLAAENDLDPKRWGYETGEMTVYFDDVTVVETGVDMSEVPDKVKIGGDEHQPLIEKRILSNHSWGEMVDRKSVV